MNRSIAILGVVLLTVAAVAFAQRLLKAGDGETTAPKAKDRPTATAVEAGAAAPGSQPSGEKPALLRRPRKTESNAPRYGPAPQRPKARDWRGVERVRDVIPLRSAPAVDVAERINELLRSERASQMEREAVTVVPEPIGNRLLVSASPSMFEELRELIEKIDARPKCVVVETLIVEFAPGDEAADSPLDLFRESAPSQEEVAGLVEELRKHANVEILARPTVTTLDNQPAFLQLGRRIPGLDSTVGLTLGLTPRISDDNVVTMEIDLEKSEVVRDGPEADAAARRSKR